MAETPKATLTRLEAMLIREPARAEFEAQALLRRGPGNGRAALVLGTARRRRGDLVGAARALVALAKAHPRMVEAQLELAVVLLALGEHDSGAERLGHAVDLDPALAEAWLEDAVASDPSDTTLRLALADALYRQGKPAAAIGHLGQLLARDASAPGPVTLMAACQALMSEDLRE